MKVLQRLLSLLSFGAPLVLANPNCPIYGAEFPKPQRLTDSAIWKTAMENLKTTFDDLDQKAVNYSFTVQLFSTNPGPPVLFERFHTAQNLPSNTTGVKKVDIDTVFRLGSVTKIYTVLAFLAETGDKYFNHPITEFVPELQDIVNRRGDGPVDELRSVKWEDITIEALLSQMSGIERDYLILGEIIGAVPLDRAVSLGFPPLGARPPCGANPLCNRTQFFEGISTAYPSFAPWKTPAYSNIAFQLVAYALEKMTGRSFVASLNATVLDPLNMRHTYYYNPPEKVGIIPRGDVWQTGWKAYIGDEAPSGNMFASTGDLTTLGRAIMSSTVLKPLMTRRWLKPVSYSADNVAAVGMPWGLRRLRLSSDNPHRTVTAFTKAGGVGDYSSLLTILPEFDLGITVMVAGPRTEGGIWSMADFIGAIVLPAYDAATRDDANSRYGGRYVADPAVYPNLTSSIEFTTDPAKPGLGISSWVSNGTDMLPVAQALQSGLSVPSDPAAGNSSTPSARLYYTGLQSGPREAFKAVFEAQGAPSNPGTGFSTDCGTWIDYTGVTYAGMPLDEFIFESDNAGKVLSVKNLALNITLQKM
ncbi:beta-lactamase/transpeptidase-like protein [Apiospora kogelbergensis]|uniref:Beta-lactamase/transpeptidase-like protein n=1 Tax=Apiospora kogelbergensis TaxID=1337665 RepID=A0AAW0QVS9_9PEZI